MSLKKEDWTFSHVNDKNRYIFKFNEGHGIITLDTVRSNPFNQPMIISVLYPSRTKLTRFDRVTGEKTSEKIHYGTIFKEMSHPRTAIYPVELRWYVATGEIAQIPFNKDRTIVWSTAVYLPPIPPDIKGHQLSLWLKQISRSIDPDNPLYQNILNKVIPAKLETVICQ